MTRSRTAVLALILLVTVFPRAAHGDEGVFRLAVGSCARQDQPQPIWDAVLAARPDAFAFVGDNIYGDTADMAVMRAKYALLAAQPGFAKLRAAVPVLATWDDHDYGKNDAGAEFAAKLDSRREFATFFQLDPATLGDGTTGVYHTRWLGPEHRRVQVILLDTRSFRSPLTKVGKGYGPSADPEATLLGAAQWAWLEDQLRQPAALRVLVSSIQVVSGEHRFEKWANFPVERRRLLDLIAKTGASGVVVVSGDRHHGELSRLDKTPFGYPLFDLTASGLNQGRGNDGEANEHRIDQFFPRPNFGVIELDTAAADPTVKLEVRDERGTPVLGATVKLSELSAR